MNGSFATALLMALLAGLATSIGAALGILGRTPGRRTLSVVMGFSAGMMVMGAFGALLPNAQDIIGHGWGFAAFLVGMVGMWLLDVLVPHDYLAEKYSAPGRERKSRPTYSGPHSGKRRNSTCAWTSPARVMARCAPRRRRRWRVSPPGGCSSPKGRNGSATTSLAR